MQQRGQQDRDMIFLRAYSIDEVVMDIENSRLSRVVLTVCRQMLSETRFCSALFILFFGYFR